MTARARFRRDEGGVSAVEFALIAPVLFTLLIGLFEISLVVFLSLSLERGALAAARYGSTGSTADGLTREERIRAIVSDATLDIIDAADLTIDTRTYANFTELASAERLTDLDGDGVHDPGEPFDDVDGDGVWDGDPGVPGVGGPNAIVLYSVNAVWRPVTPFVDDLTGPFVLTASAPIRNEPF